MSASRPRYRQLVVARVVALGELGVELHAETERARPLRLSVDEWRLAQLFDGARDAAQRLAAADASGTTIPAALLEGLADRLARAGLLLRGTHEPLPVPAQSVTEQRELGWVDGKPGRAGRRIAATALPPSSMPGSRASPGLIGGLSGFVGRGTANRIRWPLSAVRFLQLGRLFLPALASRASVISVLVLTLVMAIALWQHRFEMLRNAVDLHSLYRIVTALVLSAYLVNLISMSARAAAIARFTLTQPSVGLRFGMLYVPALFVDTAGAAERASRADRMRIVGAPVMATLVLFVVAAMLWFITHATAPFAAVSSLAVMGACVISTLFRVNPLARRDGYYLLLNAYGIPDLRDAAVYQIFGFRRRPWSVARREVPRHVVMAYIVLSIAFLIAVMVLLISFSGAWLVDRFGGLGFLFIAVVLGTYMSKQLGSSNPSRSNLGWTFSWWPFSEKTTWIGGTLLLIGLLPYGYQPSGDLVVLPRAQADVRALVAGDIREVLVTEGDAVKAGQVIVRLSDASYAAKVASDEAALASLKADAALAGKGGKPEEVQVAKQAVATAKTKAEFSRINAERLKQAYQRKAVTSQEYDRARGQAEVDAQLLREAQQQLKLVSSPAASDRIASLEADIQRAEVQLKFSRQQLADTQVSSPIDGRIVSGTLQFARGNYLNVGERVALVEDAGQKLAEIRLPEASIGGVAIGNAAAAKSWAYPWRSFDGAVHAIAPAAEDSQYGKVVRVQMRVDDPQDRLKSGMTGSAKIDGGWSFAGIVFTRALMRFLLIEVWSWLP